MTEYVAACDAIRETFDCLTIIVHHSGLEGGRSRGSSALLGAADAQIGVKNGNNGNVEAVVDYMKDGSDGLELTSRLEVIEVGTDENGDPITSCIVVPVEDAKQVEPDGPRLTKNERTMLEILSEAGNRGLTTDAWNERARAVGLGINRRQDLYDLRRALQKRGLIFQGEHGWFIKR